MDVTVCEKYPTAAKSRAEKFRVRSHTTHRAMLIVSLLLRRPCASHEGVTELGAWHDPWQRSRRGVHGFPFNTVPLIGRRT